jgi:hypothetical protein
MHRTTFERIDVEAFLAETVSSTSTAALIAEFAEEQLTEAQEANAAALGRPAPFVQSVDGVKGAALVRVKPDGVIIFDFDLITDLFVWIWRLLQSVSPVLSGRYAASHEFFADGAIADPENPPIAKIYQFVSASAYAGKIEGEDGTPDSKQAPNGVYQVVAAMAAAQHPEANVVFAFEKGRPTITITVG